jgi:hypothetical protein
LGQHGLKARAALPPPHNNLRRDNKWRLRGSVYRKLTLKISDALDFQDATTFQKFDANRKWVSPLFHRIEGTGYKNACNSETRDLGGHERRRYYDSHQWVPFG